MSFHRVQIGRSISACPFAVFSVTALTAVARPRKTPLLILRVLVGHTTRTDTFFGIGVAAYTGRKRERERERELMYRQERIMKEGEGRGEGARSTHT